ncbi:MAG: 30S ribosomal protein S12 methylthiotransferase RimO [Oscillospiraceae bacterium]
MANIFFISLGCDKNRIDAEIMARLLIDGGHRIVEDISEADCAVVNTCGFIESAKKEAIDNIFDMLRAKEQGIVKAVVVTGCLAQRYRDELCELIPEADAVIGIAKNSDICEVVEGAVAGKRTAAFGDPDKLAINGKRALSTPQHYAYIKIAEGCSNHCTYCAIPKIRGRFRSRRPEDIVSEAAELVGNGVRELIIIAQDTTGYGKDLDGGINLSMLLKKLCEIDGIWKMRILYAYPDRIDDELINTLASEPKIAKYLDIPFQHANAEVLKRMARFGSKEMLLDIINKLRAAMPDITIRSTFIVGFPGETEEQFIELCEFLKQAQLDRAGCFEFSCEEGTAAEKMTPQLDDETKHRRAEQFELVQTGILAQKRLTQLGRELEVICDAFDEERELFACRSEYDAPDIDTNVFVPLEADLMPGELYRVKIVKADMFDLYAELLQ